MKRLLLLTLVAILQLLPTDVEAGKGWCRSDPVFETGGDYYAIIVTAEEKLNTVVYDLRSPSPIDVRWEVKGVTDDPANEVTVTSVGALRFRVITTDSGNTPIRIYYVHRFNGVQVFDTTANTTLTIPL